MLMHAATPSTNTAVEDGEMARLEGGNHPARGRDVIDIQRLELSPEAVLGQNQVMRPGRWEFVHREQVSSSNGSQLVTGHVDVAAGPAPGLLGRVMFPGIGRGLWFCGVAVEDAELELPSCQRGMESVFLIGLL